MAGNHADGWRWSQLVLTLCLCIHSPIVSSFLLSASRRYPSQDAVAFVVHNTRKPFHASSSTQQPDDMNANVPPTTPSGSISWDDFLQAETRSGKKLADVPRFVSFCRHHERFAQHWTKGETNHIPGMLQGGARTGPIAKVPDTGQVVRVLCHYPELKAAPRHDLNRSFQHDNNLSWVHELQKYLPSIQEELSQVLSDLPEDLWTSLRTKMGQEWSDETGWAHISFCDNFQWNEHNMAWFPETMKVLERVVGHDRMGPRLVAIARQVARSGIPDHYDYMNWMLTLHTALQGPKEQGGCGIVVNGIKKDWIVGDPSVMDTTCCHSTYNDTDEDLYLLIVDFWHPDLSTDETDGLRRFFEMNSRV